MCRKAVSAVEAQLAQFEAQREEVQAALEARKKDLAKTKEILQAVFFEFSQASGDAAESAETATADQA
eukprot:6288960-Alexandrium_andersonii.AAC.1